MTDCTHAQRNAEALQNFRDIIREETDGGRDLTRFFLNSMFDDAYRYLDGPWSYMRAIHSSMAYHTLAADGHDLFIYDSDLGRYVPADDRVRKILADSMELEWSPARVNDILTWFKDSSPRALGYAATRPRQRPERHPRPRIRRAGATLPRLSITRPDQRRMGPRSRVPGHRPIRPARLPLRRSGCLPPASRTLPHPRLALPEGRPLPRIRRQRQRQERRHHTPQDLPRTLERLQRPPPRSHPRQLLPRRAARQAPQRLSRRPRARLRRHHRLQADRRRTPRDPPRPAQAP